MADKKEDLSLVSYTLGIVSIITSFISSYGLGGILFGLVGFALSKKQKTELSKKAKKLNIIGIIIGIVFFILSILATLFLPETILP